MEKSVEWGWSKQPTPITFLSRYQGEKKEKKKRWAFPKVRCLPLWKIKKTSLCISFCILKNFPQYKIPRELCDGGDLGIFLCSHGKIFFDIWDRSAKFKNKRKKKGTNQENYKKKKTRRKEWMKEKQEIFFLCTWKFPYSCILHRSRTCLGYRPPRVTLPYLGEPPSYWNLPSNKMPCLLWMKKSPLCMVSSK